MPTHEPPPVATVDDAIAVATRALDRADATPGAAVVLTPRVARLLIDGARAKQATGPLHEWPVLRSLTGDQRIGTMQVAVDALPATPNFAFSIGYRQQSRGGPYTILCCAPVADQAYADFLAANGVHGRAPAGEGAHG